MALNESKWNMYSFVTHTWNTIKGKCPHNCSYCYMKRFPQKKVRLVEKELLTDLGKGNFIFVGSSCDMFAEDIPEEWIKKTLEHCRKHKGNRYWFQSKNVSNMFKYIGDIPEGSVIASTIESNRVYPDYAGLVSSPMERAIWLQAMGKFGFDVAVTIEPIVEFDVKQLVQIIGVSKAKWVNIGADSGNNNLPEPTKGKVEILIKELKKITKVVNKKNLDRLIK